MDYFKIIAHLFLRGKYTPDLDGKVWTQAFQYILQNADTLYFSKSDIHTVWTVSGGRLREKVKDDQLILQILKLSLPKYEGKGLILYRGECQFLYEENKIGFCWTPDISIAKKFAVGLNA